MGSCQHLLLSSIILIYAESGQNIPPVVFAQCGSQACAAPYKAPANRYIAEAAQRH